MQTDPQIFQTVIAGIIIAAACIYILFKVIRKFRKPADGCAGCSSDCSGCELTVLKKDIEEAQKKKINNKK